MTHWPANAYAVLEGWSQVEAIGPDAGKFLQSFCTNDILKLTDGAACEALFTDVKAHVVAYGWVVRRAEDRYTVLLGSDRADSLAAHLDKYLIREQVELRAAALEQVTLGAFDGDIPLTAFGPDVEASLGAPPPAVGGSRLTSEAFNQLRTRQGVPFDGLDVDHRNLPQEVDRNEQAISFTKGCYLGQEPVARIDALGRVNWLLRGLEVDGPPPPAGAELLHEGKPVGRVTSSVAAEGGSFALAYVRREHAADGAQLALDGAQAVVRRPPF